jgi:hypothetical protein
VVPEYQDHANMQQLRSGYSAPTTLACIVNILVTKSFPVFGGEAAGNPGVARSLFQPSRFALYARLPDGISR